MLKKLLFIFTLFNHNLVNTKRKLYLRCLLFLIAGYFWHITDIHYDVNYTTHGDTTRSKYQAMCIHHASREQSFGRTYVPSVVHQQQASEAPFPPLSRHGVRE